MNYVISLILMLSIALSAQAQFEVSASKSWSRYPPEIQKGGFGLNQSKIVQMDDTAEEEEVFLFTADQGHYPYFDLFRCYYAIVGYYSKEVKYISDIILSDSRELLLEDRNKDGIYELYRRYIKDGQFTVDEEGNNLKAEWRYDRIEWK